MPLFEMTDRELDAALETLQVAAGRSDPRALVLLKAAACILGSRNGSYGEPEDNFANIARAYMGMSDQATSSWDVATFSMAVKEGRLKHDSWHADSHVDLIGYAACRARIAALEWGDDRETREAEEDELRHLADKLCALRDRQEITGEIVVDCAECGESFHEGGTLPCTKDTDAARREKLAEGTWGHKPPLATRPCAWPEQCRRFGCQGGCWLPGTPQVGSAVTVAAQSQQFQGLAA